LSAWENYRLHGFQGEILISWAFNAGILWKFIIDLLWGIMEIQPITWWLKNLKMAALSGEHFVNVWLEKFFNYFDKLLNLSWSEIPQTFNKKLRIYEFTDSQSEG
jgi:hypothetical protein